jgi:ATP-dependent phosphoenolpyruvate carboxykinase
VIYTTRETPLSHRPLLQAVAVAVEALVEDQAVVAAAETRDLRLSEVVVAGTTRDNLLSTTTTTPTLRIALPVKYVSRLTTPLIGAGKGMKKIMFLTQDILQQLPPTHTRWTQIGTRVVEPLITLPES